MCNSLIVSNVIRLFALSPPPPPRTEAGDDISDLECVIKYLALWMKKVSPTHFLFRFTLVSGHVGVLYVTVESLSERIMT